MTSQQWRLKKIPEPRTLADVPSSREKLVLCWIDQFVIAQCYAVGNETYKVSKTGENKLCLPCLADETDLYDQPSSPTKLEDVPDRRVIATRDSVNLINLWFREKSQWWFSPEDQIGFTDDHLITPGNSGWQLTDCCVELETVEVEVMA